MSELEERRKACNLTQEEVAEYLGVTRLSVYRWEAGESKPSYKNRKNLEALLERIENGEKKEDIFRGKVEINEPEEEKEDEEFVYHSEAEKVDLSEADTEAAPFSYMMSFLGDQKHPVNRKQLKIWGLVVCIAVFILSAVNLGMLLSSALEYFTSDDQGNLMELLPLYQLIFVESMIVIASLGGSAILILLLWKGRDQKPKE